MLRLLLLVVAVAAIGGYFTRPEEAQMRQAADAILQDPQNLQQGFEGVGAALAGDRAYSNYYVAAKYDVTLNGDPLVQCWGAFQQVKCDRVAQRAGGDLVNNG